MRRPPPSLPQDRWRRQSRRWTSGSPAAAITRAPEWFKCVCRPGGLNARLESGMSGAPLVEVRGLTKAYTEGDVERVVLRGVDASIRRGELAVLLGRSGSGKSTLLNLISGIDLPTAGEVVIDGTQVTRLSERERTLFRRRHIGFIFQFFNLIPTLTVEENLLLPLELNADRRRDGHTVHDLLRLVGLADRATSFPDRLSGGEQQRIAVVRALAHDPLLILADEPTG